ncbi:MAG: hypothetical protein JWQ97_2574 [Phenylobacterium sp.]|nr:hypothetical protein [Phenylobacterium sp.]
MNCLRTLAAPVALALAVAAGSAAYAEAAKNWTPPAGKIYAQKLSDQTMAAHPELQSVTFHGVPPGMTKVYTMFAGSYPERIGNPDDPDDIDVITKGITLIDPRWHRNDTVKRFVVQEPLRDKSGEDIGLIVYAFKTANGSKGERVYTKAAMDMRDALQAKIPSYAALFEPAK